MQTLPRDVHMGMIVFDNGHNEIGKVEDFRFSENEDQPDVIPGDIDASDRVGDTSLVGNIAEAFAPDELPEVLRDRLLAEGYIRLRHQGPVCLGPLHPAGPDRLGDAHEVMLNVSKDDLLKQH